VSLVVEHQLCVLDPSSPGGYRELSPADHGHINSGFTERQAAELYVQGPGRYQLYIDDEPLQHTPVRGYDGWQWRPGFYAGTVRAELIPGDRWASREYLLDVTPDSRKLGQDAFRELIRDILAEDPSRIVGDEPALYALGGEDVGTHPSLQYGRLLRYGVIFLKALRKIEERPRRALKASRRSVPLSRARLVDMQTALIMARNGLLASLATAHQDRQIIHGATEQKLNVPFSAESLDSAATRCIAALARAVCRRTRHVGRRLNELASSETESETRTSVRARWPKRRSFLTGLSDALDRTLSREPFRSAQREETTAAGLTAVAADPIYARVQHLAWKILRPSTSSNRAEDWTWMSPTWDLYETWCFIRLTRVLRSLFPAFTWKRTHPAEAKRGLEGTGPEGRLRLLSQPIFRRRAGELEHSEFRSISKTLRPDFAVTFETPSTRSWFVLDAKYSQGREAVLDSMYSAHVYHDALRWFDEPPNRSLLLLPSRGDQIGWLHEQDFKTTHGVGVVTCSPDAEFRDAVVNEFRTMLGG
jgi:hypothetical protein